MNLKLMLEEASRWYGKKTALVLDNHRLSYTELNEISNRVANALIKMGIRKGDRVAMLLSNSPEFVTIYFGIVKIGAIAVPLDPKYKVDELVSLCDNSQPKALVTESPFLEPLVPALPRFKYIEQVIELNSKHAGQFLSYQEMLATSSANRIEVEPQPEDVAHIAYTSGPAFHPRGVMLSHQGLVTEVVIAGDGFQQTDKDVAVLFALPLHHAFGLVSILLTSIYRGSTVVMVPGLSIGSLMETIVRERGSIFMGVPFIYALIVNTGEEVGTRYDLKSLRMCASAGAAMPTKLIERFKKLYGLDIIDFWGQTESTAHITCQSLDGTGKFGSVGKVLPGWDLKIVDDNGKALPPNQPGEVIARGPFMKGYYDNPQATAERIKNGWLYSCDIGKIDEDDYLFLLASRKKMMIIVKGQNIYPSDIEGVLCSHPKVDQATVVGVPDKLRGEIVRAIINLKEGEVTTEHDIRQFCRQHMADYKLPKQIVFVNSLPETTASKIRAEDLNK